MIIAESVQVSMKEANMRYLWQVSDLGYVDVEIGQVYEDSSGEENASEQRTLQETTAVGLQCRL